MSALHGGMPHGLREVDAELGGRRAGEAAAPQHAARPGGGPVHEAVKLRRFEGPRLRGAPHLAQDGGAQPRLELLASLQDDPLGGGQSEAALTLRRAP